MYTLYICVYLLFMYTYLRKKNKKAIVAVSLTPHTTRTDYKFVFIHIECVVNAAEQ